MKQYIIRYPEGISQRDTRTIPNSEIARMLLDDLKFGKSIAIPIDWDIQVVDVELDTKVET